MIPEKKLMNEDEVKAFWDTMKDPEYWRKRSESIVNVVEMFRQESAMWDYCSKNNCTVQDLIDAHKNKNQ